MPTMDWDELYCSVEMVVKAIMRVTAPATSASLFLGGHDPVSMLRFR